jgi:hypothetical protein
MSSRKGKKFGLTALFPIESAESAAQLRALLRSFDSHEFGSPLSALPIVHMARFIVIDHLPYQEFPAQAERLNREYLLFVCEFDGEDVGTLVGAFLEHASETLVSVWRHCAGFPDGRGPYAIAAYFDACQIDTNLYFVDRPDDSLEDILRALAAKRAFTDFILQVQSDDPSPEALRERFLQVWSDLESRPPPGAGSL